MPVSLPVPVVVALIEHPTEPDNPVRYTRHSDRHGSVYEEFVGAYADVDDAKDGLKKRTGYPYRPDRRDPGYVERENGDLAYRIPDQGGPNSKRTLVVRTVVI